MRGNETNGLGPVERVLGDVGEARKSDPLCIITAGIHGNEPAGIVALRRVLSRLTRQGSKAIPLHGRFLALSGNRSALMRGLRHVDEDMNRVWSAERVAELRASAPEHDNSEMSEQRDLLAHIERAILSSPARVAHLDLHSTSGAGPPFTVIAGPESSRAAANNLGVPLLLGLEDVIEGTLIEYLGGLGHATVLIEGGQNEALTTIDHHEAAVWLTLVQSGVVKAADVPDLEGARAKLLQGARGLPNELEIAYCHRLEPGEAFDMLPGYANFDAVVEGQLLAKAGPGLAREVRAPWTGTLLMPRYQGQGLDGFFLGRNVG
jgi:succinylglutamate desuccinylase